MITLEVFFNEYMTLEEQNKFILNKKNFYRFYVRYKEKPAYFTLFTAFDFEESKEGKAYWQNIQKRINDVVLLRHSNGKIKSFIPILNGKIHKYCYFFDENEQLIKIVEHNYKRTYCLYNRLKKID